MCIRDSVKDAPCVIGYQLDNETKHYGTAGENVQRQFVEHLKRRFNGSLEAMNKAFGLDYWSNRIDAWEDFPDVRGSINASLTGAFARFPVSYTHLDVYKRQPQWKPPR